MSVIKNLFIGNWNNVIKSLAIALVISGTVSLFYIVNPFGNASLGSSVVPQLPMVFASIILGLLIAYMKGGLISSLIAGIIFYLFMGIITVFFSYRPFPFGMQIDYLLDLTFLITSYGIIFSSIGYAIGFIYFSYDNT